MKKSLVLAAAVAALLMSGCSQKKPEVDMTKQETTEKAAPAVTEADTGIGTVVGSEERGELTTLPESSRMEKIKELEAKAKKIYFDFDKYNIRPDQEPRVDEDAQLFSSDAAKDLTIKIEGNCDEWGAVCIRSRKPRLFRTLRVE